MRYIMSMHTRPHTRQFVKLVREGELAANVEVRIVENEGSVVEGPCLPPTEAKKLDAVRRALRAGDVKAASRLAKTSICSEVGGIKFRE